MRSWWDLTKEEQDERMAIEPLTPGSVSETFRHPASYAELRLVKTIWKYADEVRELRKIEQAARAFFSQPYDNGQHEKALRDAVMAVPSNSEEQKP